MTDIREIMENMAKTDQPNFRPITFVDDRGRTYPAFTMNRDGFFAIAGHRNKPGALQVLGAAGAGPSYPTASVSPAPCNSRGAGLFLCVASASRRAISATRQRQTFRPNAATDRGKGFPTRPLRGDLRSERPRKRRCMRRLPMPPQPYYATWPRRGRRPLVQAE
jgi:hypothetical protein